jgi:hypothetical protein
MHKDLGKYVVTKEVIGSPGASDSWLRVPDFYFADGRSRNIIDMKGHSDLSRSGVAKGGRIGTLLRTLSQVTVTSGKVAVTLGKVPVTLTTGSEIVWQAGMCKGMRNVRGYVPLQVGKSPEYGRCPDGRPEKSEKHRW